MNDISRTLVAIVIATLLVATAALTRSTPLIDARFSDQGEPFFASFTDPLTPVSLEVVSFDASNAAFRPFKVELQNGRWVIPSHHGYPADARENMARAASAFIGLNKEQVVSDRAADHEALGVLAPDDPHAPLSGRGTRVTLRDARGAELASLIVGLPAPDPAAERGGAEAGARRYVRVPDKARVYAVTFPTAFSTRFADWVETDLLKIEGKRIDRLLVDRYEVDERAGEQRAIERLRFTRVLPEPIGSDAPRWTMESQPGGGLGEGQLLDEERVQEALSAMTDLRIAGVRPKPPALAAALSGSGSGVAQSDLRDLQARGFFVSQEGRFLANEGEVTLTAEDGVVYNIAFGEVLFGREEEISAGVERLQGAEPASAGADSGSEARYVMVRVTFDASMFPEPTPPAPSTTQTPTEPSAAGEPEAWRESEAAPAAVDEAAQKEFERLSAERESRLLAGKARADALTKRFADWYYVIDATSYAALRPTRAKVVRSVQGASETGVGPGAPPAAQP